MANAQPSGWTDALLIREIRAGGQRRNRAWEYIYKAWRGYYLSPVLRSGGTEEQVDEVLGQVFIDVEKQLLKEDFEMREASLRTYIIGAIIKAWSRLREYERRRQTIDLDLEKQKTGQQGSVEEDFIRQERQEELDSRIARLGEKCRKVLTMYLQKYSMREIAAELGYQNEQSAKTKKMDCHKKLLELTDNL